MTVCVCVIWLCVCVWYDCVFVHMWYNCVHLCVINVCACVCANVCVCVCVYLCSLLSDRQHTQYVCVVHTYCKNTLSTTYCIIVYISMCMCLYLWIVGDTQNIAVLQEVLITYFVVLPNMSINTYLMCVCVCICAGFFLTRDTHKIDAHTHTHTHTHTHKIAVPEKILNYLPLVPTYCIPI